MLNSNWQKKIRVKAKKSILGMVALAFPATLAFGGLAAAATNVVVTPANQQGWSTADTRPGGAVNFIFDSTSPAPNGALQLTTDATTTSKAQYLHAANTPLSQVTDLSYYTKQVAPAGPVADPSYQLVTCLLGLTAPVTPANPTGCNGFTTLVFEPYQNPGNNGNAAIVNNVWQQWDVDQGLFWSTRSVTCSNGAIVGTAGGPATYTLAALKTACPNAVVGGFGVNIGSNNPGYNVETDLFNFNGTIYNFELTNVPTNKDQCKNGGYANYTDANGQAFTNQGQCVSYVNSSSNKHKNTNKVTVSNNNNQTSNTGNANNNNNTNGGNSQSGNASNTNNSSNTININN